MGVFLLAVVRMRENLLHKVLETSSIKYISNTLYIIKIIIYKIISDINCDSG